ncbi:MAG: Xaa-Pro peptidase family protein [Pseudomonadota bacterium]
MPDFPTAEFEARLARAQKEMTAAGLDALFLTTESELRWFTGFRTLFWQSPTRPWFLVVPRVGEPVAIIPEIGAALMAATWVADIRIWSSPHPTDDGVTLVCEALAGFDQVGTPMGPEASLRMPLADFQRLGAAFEDASPLMKRLRMLKSAAEVEKIARICAIGSAGFARAPDLFRAGQTMRDAFAAFRIALIEEGADDVPYLVGGKGPDGYADVISPPSDEALREGDVLMLDTGATRDGYFCDFDRNFAIGRASDAARTGYAALWLATEAGLAAARPGATCADLWRAMHGAMGGGDGSGDVGRYGHGLGMQLTEQPSIAPFDETFLEPGMVMTLEPSIATADGRMLVQEENIVITEDAPRVLTTRAAPELPVI